MTEADIRDNPDAKRYELPIGDQIAVVTYNLSEPNLMITETLVPQALEGQGIASRLARHVIADARARPADPAGLPLLQRILPETS